MVNFMPPPRIVAVLLRPGAGVFDEATVLVRFSDTPAESELLPLFKYFADEVAWEEAELMSKTRAETDDLRYKKDMKLLADF